MSAITGIFYRDGRLVDTNQIKKMNDVLSHRGPDGADVWCEGSIALGHQMLWTTPESLKEKLPFEEDDLVITADARIDNRKELSEELRIPDVEDVSDSYYILKSYQKWGETCPEKLLGDFAFVIWDKKKEILFCARDHMGVKPFYYYLGKNAFYFASEIKALFTINEIQKKLNKIKVADYLVGMYEDREITFYEKIIRLPAANSLLINFQDQSFWKYWELDLNKKIEMSSDEEYAAAFLNIFKDAVNCRLRSNSSIGSLMSGGLDSSSIVCTARDSLKTKKDIIKTFSATFEDVPECDEQYYIKKIIEGGGIEPFYVEADKISPLWNIENVLWFLDEASVAPNSLILWNLFRKAHETSVRVLFDGFNGDTTVSHGDRFFIDYIFSLNLIKGINELKKLSDREDISFFKLFLFSSIPLIPLVLIKALELLPISFNGLIERFELINESLIVETGIKERYREKQDHPMRSARRSKVYHYILLTSGLIQTAFERRDKMAAAEELEVRYPFCDRRLVEFCLSVPIEQKINNGWDRIIMRNAMENILPIEIQWRQQKTTVAPNFRRNILLFEKSNIENLFFNHSDLIISYVNNPVLNEFLVRFQNKDEFSMKLWRLIILTLWLEKTEFN
ncbi:MAG: lasso peptide isopeptide bond-forming cyclase [Methanobacterium formicicum]